MVWFRLIIVAAFACTTVLPERAVGQSSPAAPSPALKGTGFTAYSGFFGTANSDEQVYVLDSRVGYNFSWHFGADLGVPVYFVRASSSVAGGSVSTNGLGNPYVDLRVRLDNPMVNYRSVLTGFVPTSDSKLGLSTGRATFDWTNRFDRSFSSLTPFVEAGIANTIVDSPLFLRPYTTLGFNTHFQGGANVDLEKFFRLGASAYGIFPSGQQTVFSKVAGRGRSGSHGRVFNTNQQTVGSADIARDDGYSTWIVFSPKPYMDMELAYTRSIHYALNFASFGIGFNVGYLVKKRTPQ